MQVPVFQAPVLGKLARWLNSFHIYGFTLVSGYLFCFLKYEKGKYWAWGDFLKNKAKRLLVPYLFTAGVWVIPIGYYFFSFGWSDIIKRFALATSPNQLWFIVMLFDVFVIFEFLSDFFYRYDVKGLLAVLVLYVGGGRWFPNVFQIRLACKYAIFFWVGFKIRQHGSYRIRKIPPVIWVLTSMALFAAQMAISRQGYPVCEVINIGMALALNLVGAVMAFVVLQKIADVIDWKNNAFILF